jgi:sporulation protein YhbH
VTQRIDEDRRRFRQIVQGQVRKNLRKYISRGELMGRQGNKKVAIPMPQIEIPRFTFGDKEKGGVGQGEGEPGDPLGQGEAEGGAGEAGNQPGEHALEVEFTIEELAHILGEELALPKIEPRGAHKLITRKERYTGIRQTGPESLRHFKRTFKQALKRQVAMGTYNPKAPVIIPVREDKRYRSWKEERLPHSNAVIIYMMDVSGSMGEEQKEIVRIETYWIDTWLRTQYQGLESRYIIHDASAKEVDQETFFRTREAGGTMISSAYRLCLKIIEEEYPTEEWNIYPFHFSDGDNWSSDDTGRCMSLVEEALLPRVNVFCYGQVRSPYGSGQFIRDLRERFEGNEDVITSEISGREAIMDSIKDFLGKGK